MPKKGKSAKNQKNAQMKNGPYSSPMMLMIISDGKNGPKTRENSHMWRGWVKIGEEEKNKCKNVISPNRIGRKLKYGLSYIATFRIQELANGDFGVHKKF